jgi:hypothetical protein
MNPLRFAALATALVLTLVVASPAAAHPHTVTRAHQGAGQVIANGQNHPGFQGLNADGLNLSCAGTLEPADIGPAGWGLETAHHGPDAGTPGKADGCYATTSAPPADGNPAID